MFRKEHFRAMLETWPKDKPVYMVNLLKFKKDGGRELYKQYLRKAEKFTKNLNSRIVVYTEPRHSIIGSAREGQMG